MYMSVFNIGSLYCQSIASSNGPVRRRHIFLVKHIRFPTIQHPRGRTFRWIHKPTAPLNPLGTSPCLPLWDQRIPWSRGSMSRKPFCNYFERRLVLQPAWVWLLESHLKTTFQILKKFVWKERWVMLFQRNKEWMSYSEITHLWISWLNINHICWTRQLASYGFRLKEGGIYKEVKWTKLIKALLKKVVTCNPTHLAIWNFSTWSRQAGQVDSSVYLCATAQFQQGDVVSHAVWSFVAVVIDDSFDLHILFCSNIAVSIMSSKPAKFRNIHQWKPSLILLFTDFPFLFFFLSCL